MHPRQFSPKIAGHFLHAFCVKVLTNSANKIHDFCQALEMQVEKNAVKKCCYIFQSSLGREFCAAVAALTSLKIGEV